MPSLVPRSGSVAGRGRPLSADIIRKRLDYWTFLVGPKFSAKEREPGQTDPSLFDQQVEYCFNFVFKRNYPIHKLFERSCDVACGD